MGLEVTHDAFCGAYSNFDHWRKELARAAGLPPLDLMEGFFDLRSYTAAERQVLNEIDGLPIKWECLRDDPIIVLLNHSDCDGEIAHEHLKALADRLLELAPLMPESYDQERCRRFAAGCMDASEQGDCLEFH